MDDKPLVTVYITTYNRCNLLKRALYSVLTQSYEKLDIIVVDDCSSDDTIEYLKMVAEKDRRLRYFKNESNSGACASRNKAIFEAKGEFITGLDDDDTFHCERVAFLVRSFEPKYSFICTSFNVIDKGGSFKSSCTNLVFNASDLFYDNVAGNQLFTYTVRVLELCGFDEELSSSQDLDLMVRLCLSFGSAKRFKERTYSMYIDHEQPRISSSSGKISGMRHFLHKHGSKMTRLQRLYRKSLIDYWMKKPDRCYRSEFVIVFINSKKAFKRICHLVFC